MRRCITRLDECRRSGHPGTYGVTLGSTTLGTLTYTYDAAGNRTSVGGTWARTGLPQAVASATYDAANRQLTFGGQTLTYDANGNLVNGGTNTYTWNARSQLVALNGRSVTASFTYDAFGSRQSKLINGTSTQFLYDGVTPVQEIGANPATLLTGLGIDEYLTRTDATGTHTLLTDALGSTRALTDPTGALQDEYTYEPFGVLTGTGTNANPYQYTGRENDGTGLYYVYVVMLRFVGALATAIGLLLVAVLVLPGFAVAIR
jgi:YD repeat-containing protein